MVHIKMDAVEQLLLSEGVCRQLGIVTYHPSIQDWKGGRKLRGGRKRLRASPPKAQVPAVHVGLLRTTRVKPCPPDLPAGSYWYGTKRAGTGRPPKWTEHVSSQNVLEPQTSPCSTVSQDQVASSKGSTRDTSPQPLPTQTRYNLRNRRPDST